MLKLPPITVWITSETSHKRVRWSGEPSCTSVYQCRAHLSAFATSVRERNAVDHTETRVSTCGNFVFVCVIILCFGRNHAHAYTAKIVSLSKTTARTRFAFFPVWDRQLSDWFRSETLTGTTAMTLYILVRKSLDDSTYTMTVLARERRLILAQILATS